MSDGQPSNDDRDLLSRLDALKKSTVEFDDANPVLAAHFAADTAQTANPAHILFSDLTSRFQSLKDAHNKGYLLKKDGTPLEISELQNENNDKTVEELLAELGPDEQWTLGKDEDLEIEALLKDAHGALGHSAEDTHDQGDTESKVKQFGINTEESQADPEVDSEPESDNDSGEDKKLTVDQEAELTLQRLLDDIALQPLPNTLVSQANSDHEAGIALRSAGHDEPEFSPTNRQRNDEHADEAVDDALMQRFASLSLPQTEPQNAADDDDALSLPSVPSGIKTNASKSAAPPEPEDEIDTWCIICLDDVNLKCLGCDGDLYCTRCWLTGHTGEDAGYEERTHKAVQYVKGGGVKKEKKGRRLVSA